MSAPTPTTRRRMTRALVARVGDEHFAFPIAAVREAVDAPRLLPVPLAPTGMLGQCDHRGGLLPVLSAKALLGASRTTEVEAGTLLVMADVDVPYGLLVDDLSDMVAVDGMVRRALPPGADRTGMLKGLLVLDDWLAGVVDLDALHAAAARMLASMEDG